MTTGLLDFKYNATRPCSMMHGGGRIDYCIHNTATELCGGLFAVATGRSRRLHRLAGKAALCIDFASNESGRLHGPRQILVRTSSFRRRRRGWAEYRGNAVGRLHAGWHCKQPRYWTQAPASCPCTLRQARTAGVASSALGVKPERCFCSRTTSQASEEGLGWRSSLRG